MTEFDYTVIAIIVLSALLGFWRGAVYEVLSLMGWIGAVFVARTFAADVAPLLPVALGTDLTRSVAAFLVLFVGTLIVAGLGAWVFSKFVKWIGLAMVDKSLGTLFGAIRGIVIVLVLVFLAGKTDLPQEALWRDALLSRPVEKISLSALALLPDSVALQVNNHLDN